ncbi:MAG: hypothetical protein AAGG09_22700 [Pseudomonadota bacterium]
MDAKAAKQVTEKGFKFTFWEEISGKEKKMPAEQSKKVLIALKSFQRLGISPDGKIDASRLEKPEDAANVVAALDAVEEPMGKIYKDLKADKHWKKAIENYGAMLTAVRSLAEPKAKGSKGEAPAAGGAMFAVADVIPTLNTVAKAVEQIQQQLTGMDRHYDPFVDVLGAVDEPGANLDVLSERGLSALQQVARAVMAMSKTFGGVKSAFPKLTDPSEINPTDKNLSAYSAKHAATVKGFREVGTALEEEKSKLVDNQKLLKSTIDGIRAGNDKAKDDINKDLMEHRVEDDKPVLKEKGDDYIKANDMAYKVTNKMRSLFFTVGNTQSEIESMTKALLDLPGTSQDKLARLKALTPDIKSLGGEVQTASKSVAAAEQALKLLTPADKLGFTDDTKKKEYGQLLKAAPEEVKKTKVAVGKSSEAFRALLDTVTQVKQAVVAAQ